VDIDANTRYTVVGYGGVAWYINSYETVYDQDGFEYTNNERVVCTMVGDDRKFIFDVEDLTELDDSEYCSECGQIGCGW